MHIYRPCKQPDVDRSFPAKIGLGVHRHHAHLNVANGEVNLQIINVPWSDEEHEREEDVIFSLKYADEAGVQRVSGGVPEGSARWFKASAGCLIVITCYRQSQVMGTDQFSLVMAVVN